MGGINEKRYDERLHVGKRRHSIRANHRVGIHGSALLLKAEMKLAQSIKDLHKVFLQYQGSNENNGNCDRLITGKWP